MKTLEINGSRFIGQHIEIGVDVRIGSGNDIRSAEIIIGDHSDLGDINQVLALGQFKLADLCRMGDQNAIRCNDFQAGQYLYWEHHNTVGHGGELGPDSKVTLGERCMVTTNVTLNPNEHITIGDNVGIGHEVGIWTHGIFLSPLLGFPSAFGPVEIGNNVWITGRSQILPNTHIGDNVVIAMNSVVNRDLPTGVLAGGSPVKIIKSEAFPATVEFSVSDILADYHALAQFKGITDEAILDGQTILFRKIAINTTNQTWTGEWDRVSQDLRDYLRRRGIKIYTGERFQSLPHPMQTQLTHV